MAVLKRADSFLDIALTEKCKVQQVFEFECSQKLLIFQDKIIHLEVTSEDLYIFLTVLIISTFRVSHLSLSRTVGITIGTNRL